MNKVALLVVLVMLLESSRCDLPVHCVKHEVVGKWIFELEAPTLVGHGPLPCGHDVPDDPHTSAKARQNEFSAASTVEVELLNNNRVSNEKHSMWTMVYDEGFEVKYRNVKYFAFNKFTHHRGDYRSYCGETLVGWYKNLETGERGCYRGHKVGASKKGTRPANHAHIVQPKLVEINDNIQDGPFTLND
jgi:cathepsin C